ncbi:MAG TPA: glycogen debranching N-terminal domain-containing protein [Steroidobacter sp.]|nr:glycogen debranching N-terminal domain-containing protein [Steroidobacteraceae bacterium]HLS82031.1 glycogen debranching N-terminal domain-containing protein [Steroidobacter sp.]
MGTKSGDRRGLLPRYTLKDGETFMLADALGDIQEGRDDGLFTQDTRVLSRWELSIDDRRPSLLGASISHDNTLFTAHVTNLPLAAPGELSIPQGVIHIERSRFLWDTRLHERLRLVNFSAIDVEVPLTFFYTADFADIFEVQGHTRARRGEIFPPQVDEHGAQISYRGLDQVVRTTRICFSRKPDSIDGGKAQFRIFVPRGAIEELYVEIGAQRAQAPSAQRFAAAANNLSASMHERLSQGASVSTTARPFNQWIERSHSDLALLTTSLKTGPYPYAGIPWFATQFGRDAIITALQTLWLNPSLAAGVLRFLASTQAREESAFQDSQPGKIMHEMRRGEMAALREVPYGCYYGGVDTTPLFVMLAGAYEQRTADRSVVDAIWDALLNAIGWIERRMDQSPTGFLDYARGERSGLVNQAWKDSQDSIFHADGRFPNGPVAVVEVQGYAHAAFKAMAALAAGRADQAHSAAWLARAERLRVAIEERFWIPQMTYYALALDGDGAPCKVYASNAGHLLYCEAVAEERAAAVAAQLLSPRFASGWGVRTLAEGEPRYNPMSYHNGSIWPHDTSICAAGMARYGRRTNVVQVLNEMFEAATHFGMRLPELFCGFSRIHDQDPVPYPVACLPQAWASGSVFMLLQACLGVRIEGAAREVHIERPTLPDGVDSLTVHDLPVGEATIDLHFHHIGEEVVAAPARHHQAGVRVLEHL